MNTQISRLAVAALLTLGVTTAALAQSPAPAKPSVQTGGQGMMDGTGTAQGGGMMGGGMMGGGMMGNNNAGMMNMMSAMTRMANTCNRMMENASNAQHHPDKTAPRKSNG